MIKVAAFVDYVEQQRKRYLTNNVIITMGGDFTFMDANVYFKNLDKLIRFVEREINFGELLLNGSIKIIGNLKIYKKLKKN